MATRGKDTTTGRLTELISYQRKRGGSVAGSVAGGIKERLKEKFDPRQLINQKGLMTALFPGLKAYQSKTNMTDISKPSMQSTSFDEIKPTLEIISYNTKMAAKNSMVLPALHRDVNVIRQNIVKLVKMKGGDARTKADMYFVNAKDREEKYERELKKQKSKRDNAEKLKEDEENSKKGIVGKIFSAIVGGLKSIVGAILKLGKEIILAFKFMAEVIVDVMSSAIKFVLKPIKLLGNLMKNFIGNFFKNRMMYLLVSSIIRGTISSVFGLLFSKKTLVRLGYFLLGVFASTFGLQWAVEKYRQLSMTGDTLSESDSLEDKIGTAKKASENYKDLLKTAESKSTLPYQITDEEFQDLKNSNILPQNANREATVGRVSGYAGKQMEVSEGMFTDIIPSPDEVGAPIQNALFNFQSYQNYYKLKNKGLYKVPVPGLKDPLTLLLTKEEALEFGKKTMLYDLTMEALKNEVSQREPNEEIVNSLIKKLNSIQSDVAEKSLKLVSDQYNKDYKEYDLIKNSLTILKDLAPNPTLLGLVAKDVTDYVTGTDFYKNEEKIFSENVDKFLSSTGIDSLNNLKNDELINSLKNKLENRMKDFQAGLIIDKTNQNISTSSKIKQPIIINSESNEKKSLPYDGLGSPASAWNNDFIDKHFSDIINNPVGLYRN